MQYSMKYVFKAKSGSVNRAYVPFSVIRKGIGKTKIIKKVDVFAVTFYEILMGDSMSERMNVRASEHGVCRRLCYSARDKCVQMDYSHRNKVRFNLKQYIYWSGLTWQKISLKTI